MFINSKPAVKIFKNLVALFWIAAFILLIGVLWRIWFSTPNAFPVIKAEPAKAGIASDDIEAASVGLMIVRPGGRIANILAEVDYVTEEAPDSYIVTFIAPSGYLSSRRLWPTIGSSTQPDEEWQKPEERRGLPLAGSVSPVSSKGIMCRSAYPAGKFSAGEEGIIHLGDSQSLPLSAYQLRNKIASGPGGRLEQPPVFFQWGNDPRPGIATAYAVDLVAPKIKKVPLTVNADGSVMIAGVNGADWRKLAELEWKRVNGTISVLERSQLYNLSRRLRINFLPALGSPIMQNGKKVGIFMGGNVINPLIVPVSQLRKSVLDQFVKETENQQIPDKLMP